MLLLLLMLIFYWWRRRIGVRHLRPSGVRSNERRVIDLQQRDKMKQKNNIMSMRIACQRCLSVSACDLIACSSCNRLLFSPRCVFASVSCAPLCAAAARSRVSDLDSGCYQLSGGASGRRLTSLQSTQQSGEERAREARMVDKETERRTRRGTVARSRLDGVCW